MKHTLIIGLASLLLISSSAAVAFHLEGFGQSLNGWNKKGIAYYTIDRHTYRTYRPTMSPTPGGGMFLSTRVEHSPKMGKTTTSYIELSFDSAGRLLTSQIRVNLAGKQITTGLITRPAREIVAEGEEAGPDPEPWSSPVREMQNNTFQALDAQFNKLEQSEIAGKRDIFSRVFGRDYSGTDLSAALRHNYNLLLSAKG